MIRFQCPSCGEHRVQQQCGKQTFCPHCNTQIGSIPIRPIHRSIVKARKERRKCSHKRQMIEEVMMIFIAIGLLLGAAFSGVTWAMGGTFIGFFIGGMLGAAAYDWRKGK